MIVINKIKALFKQVSQIGFSEDLSYIEKIRVVLLNRLLLLIIVLNFGFFLAAILKNDIDAVSIFCITIYTSFAFYLQSKKKYTQAYLYCIISFPFMTFLQSLLYGEDLRLEYWSYILLTSTIIYFDKLGHRIAIFFYITGLHFLSFLFFKNYSSPYAKYVDHWDALIIFIAVGIGISIIILFFYEESQKHYAYQLLLTDELRQKNEKLQKLAKENIDQNKKLSGIILDNKSKAKLLEILAHDIKGPSHVFNNLTKKISYLLRKEEPQRIKELAEDFEKIGTNLSYTLENLLNWTVSQKDGIKKDIKKIDLDFLLNETINDLDSFSRKKNIFVKNNIVKNLTCLTDPNILKIIINNILHNAIKFSLPNSEIILNTKVLENKIEISIRDFGKGMSPKYIERVMSNELVTSLGTNYEKGHGLGVNSCFGLITHLQGEIKIKSEVGKGTCFYIYIPLEENLKP